MTKCPTGIRGLDEITHGGLPCGRPTLVCGSAGSGKTLLAMEFVVRGARDFSEPGVFMSFEETEDELASNVASLGYDLPALIGQGMLLLDHVRVERSEIEITGEFDLEGLFVRLGSAIDMIGAKRVAIDSLEALFAGVPDESTLRAELRRLFAWLKAKGVTFVITGEQGDGKLTRHGLEEYVSDCVIFLDHRIVNQIGTRRLRIVKYRGSSHGTNEYPTMIDKGGLSVLPISSLNLDNRASDERVSSGVTQLDEMLGGQGYFKGSTILISGTAGTGKTTLTSAFVHGLCADGKRCLYMAYEESPAQILRNMRSIGLHLKPCIDQGLLRFQAARSSLFGLEQHLMALHHTVDEYQPDAVVIDPITTLTNIGDSREVAAMVTRMVDFLKQREITTMLTTLIGSRLALEKSDIGISSLMDTWLLLQNAVIRSEQIRTLTI